MSATRITGSTAESPVIVLGMHRSGTSYLASVIQALGYNMGNRMVEPGPGNSRGYFEDSEFVNLHVDILQRIHPPVIPDIPIGNIWIDREIPVELTDSEESRAQDLIRRRRTVGNWGWKDPRTCLFMEYWERQFPGAILVAIYRHPLEVYSSVLRRTYPPGLVFDEPLIIKTWTFYNRTILNALKRHGGRKVVLGAGGILGCGEELVQLLSRSLDLRLAPDRGCLPTFHEPEFVRTEIDQSIQGVFSRLFPAAAGVLDELQETSAAPLTVGGCSEPWGELLSELCERCGPSSRSLLLPVLAALCDRRFRDQRDSILKRGLRDMTDIEAGLVWRAEQATSELRDSEEIRRREQEALTGEFAKEKARVEARIQDLDQTLGDFSAELVELRAQYLVRLLDPSHRDRGVYLWGANAIGARVVDLLTSEGVEVRGVIDRKGGTALEPLQAMEKIRLELSGSVKPVVLICTRTGRDSVAQFLYSQGLSHPEDFLMLPD